MPTWLTSQVLPPPQAKVIRLGSLSKQPPPWQGRNKPPRLIFPARDCVREESCHRTEAVTGRGIKELNEGELYGRKPMQVKARCCKPHRRTPQRPAMRVVARNLGIFQKVHVKTDEVTYKTSIHRGIATVQALLRKSHTEI